MENKITKLFYELSNTEVIECIKEILEAETSGIFENFSKVRALNEKVVEITDSSYSVNLFLTQNNILRQGALRYLKLKNGTNKTT